MTTSSLTSAPSTDQVVSTKRQVGTRRRKVVHYYVVEHSALAESVGLPTVSLCGRVIPAPVSQPQLVQNVGGLMVATEQQDCRMCVRATERHLAEKNAS